ncbi:MAG: molybdenum cofactor guanylyltransferase [Candidatus Limnocylindrales bacterium]
MPRTDEPIGVILAGGRGTRIGGAKATVELLGRPLIAYPAASLQGVLADVAVIAKADTAIPPLPGVVRWPEPAEPRHPLVGIVEALGRAAGRPVLVCAADMPCVSHALLDSILAADPRGAPAVVPSTGGALQPMLALYLPAALEPLSGALGCGELGPLRRTVERLEPWLLEVQDSTPFFNINSRADLAAAAERLRGAAPRGDHPNVKS